MINLRTVSILTLLTSTLSLVGCASMQESYKGYDPTRRYLKTEQYFSDPIDLPPAMSSTKLEEYYPVPEISMKSDEDKPSLIPPSNSMKTDA
jgi:uncharacterized lipoprotein